MGGSTRSERLRVSTAGTSAGASGKKNSHLYSRLRGDAAGAESRATGGGVNPTHPVPSTRSSVLSAELVEPAPQSPNPASAFSSCSSSVAAALSPLALNTTSPPATVSTSRTVPRRLPLSACTIAKPSSTPAPPCSAKNSSSEGGRQRSRSRPPELRLRRAELPAEATQTVTTRGTKTGTAARREEPLKGACAVRRTAAAGKQCSRAGATARATALIRFAVSAAAGV